MTGGAQGHYNVKPDITCFGKVIGGGLPVGAFGASAALMAHLSPEGPIYQAGTLSGNPLAMAAGMATIAPLFEAGFYDKLAERTGRLAKGLCDRMQAAGHDACYTHAGTMFSVFFRKEAPRNFHEVKDSDAATFQKYFWAMLDEGVYLAPSAFEAGFTSAAHTDDVIDATLAAAEKALKAIG